MRASPTTLHSRAFSWYNVFISSSNEQDKRNTSSTPKWLSVTLTLARLRHADYWPSTLVVSTTLSIEDNNYSETHLKVAMSKDFLMMKVCHENIWLWSSKFVARQINWTIILRQKHPRCRTIILGRREKFVVLDKTFSSMLPLCFIINI